MQNPWLAYAGSRSMSWDLPLNTWLLHISWTFERFSLNGGQILISVRRCAGPLTQLPRLKIKVTLQGLRIYPWISCLLHISWTLWTLFIKLHPNVPLNETVCRTHDSAMQTQGQGHQINPAPYLLNPLEDFHSTSPKCSSQWDSVQNSWLG